jgi:hypothetical protein
VLERSQGNEKSNDQAILPALIAHAKSIQARREQALDLQDRKLRLQDCKLSAVERMWCCEHFTRIGELLTADQRLFNRVVTRIAATPVAATSCARRCSRAWRQRPNSAPRAPVDGAA